MKSSLFIKLFYLFQFFFDFIFIYAVEKLFYLSRGISLTQIGILLFFCSLMTLLLEVPTGIIADHWSRRKMLILSGLFYSVCYFILIFSNSFWLFLLGFLFRTLGGTFASGTLQAYVYDYLKINQKENDFEKIWGRGNAFRTLGIGVAVAFGGLISEISYVLVLIMSSISVLMVSFIAIIWPEVPMVTKTGEKNYWTFLKQAITEVRSNQNLLRIVIFSGVVLSIFASLEEYNDVYLQFLGFPNSIIGLVFLMATIGQSIASIIAEKFKKYSWTVLNFITIIGSVILFLASVFKTPFMAIGILLLGIFLEFSRVLNEGIIQREVEPSKRATIASLNSFLHNLIPFQLMIGIIANKNGLQSSYFILGILVLFYFVFLVLFKPKIRTAK